MGDRSGGWRRQAPGAAHASVSTIGCSVTQRQAMRILRAPGRRRSGLGHRRSLPRPEPPLPVQEWQLGPRASRCFGEGGGRVEHARVRILVIELGGTSVKRGLSHAKDRRAFLRAANSCRRRGWRTSPGPALRSPSPFPRWSSDRLVPGRPVRRAWNLSTGSTKLRPRAPRSSPSWASLRCERERREGGHVDDDVWHEAGGSYHICLSD